MSITMDGDIQCPHPCEVKALLLIRKNTNTNRGRYLVESNGGFSGVSETGQNEREKSQPSVQTEHTQL